MTDNEITKALECCTNNKCHTNGCPLVGRVGCMGTLTESALALINRQKAEIERLQDENKYLRFYIGIKNDEQFKDIIAKTETTESHIKAEAIKEFAERLKEEASFECDVSLGYGRPCYEDAVPIVAIDNLVKEMVGDV